RYLLWLVLSSLSSTVPPPPARPPLSLHDALPISGPPVRPRRSGARCPAPRVRRCSPSPARAPRGRTGGRRCASTPTPAATGSPRSEEHTSELQSRFDLVCRLLLEKKKRTRSRDGT